MLLAPVLGLWLIGAASPQPLDTAKLSEVRSAVAEAAVIHGALARGRVTRAYAEGIDEDIRRDLKALLRDPQIKPFAAEAIHALDAGDWSALDALKRRLMALERTHGRAG